MDEAPKKPKMLSDLILEQANLPPATETELAAHERIQKLIDGKLADLRAEKEAEETPVIRKPDHVYKELETDKGRFVFDLYVEKGQPFCEFFRRGQENVWKYKFWLSCRMLMSELLYNNTNSPTPPLVFTAIRIAIKEILNNCEVVLMRAQATGLEDGEDERNRIREEAQDLADANEMERKIASGDEKTIQMPNDL